MLTNVQLDLLGGSSTVLDSPQVAAISNRLRDRGIKQSKDHAEAVIEGWHDMAYRVFEGYARTHQEFMTEDVRIFVRNNSVLGDPPDARAWGAVTRRAVRSGLVRCLRYVAQRDPKSHGSPKPVWTQANAFF